MQQKHVVSLFDYTGFALAPWAASGDYLCFAYDWQHPAEAVEEDDDDDDPTRIRFMHADLDDEAQLRALVERHGGGRTAFVSAFPPCTDLSCAGAPFWARKRADDPDFQTRAVARARRCAQLAQDELGCDAWYVENPVGALSTLWRKPDATFQPWEYGGYLPVDDVHPRYPDYIPSRDAYTKRTCLWHGPGFALPPKRPVEPITLTYPCTRLGTRVHYSPQAGKLGGKSAKTKNIRSATPRGFAQALFEAHAAAAAQVEL